MQSTSAPNANKFETALVAQFGQLMSTIQLAELLGRSPEALRANLNRYKNDSFNKGLNGASVRVGRRLYYRTLEVAELLSCKA